jgi:hypothetical protein
VLIKWYDENWAVIERLWPRIHLEDRNGLHVSAGGEE